MYGFSLCNLITWHWDNRATEGVLPPFLGSLRLFAEQGIVSLIPRLPCFIVLGCHQFPRSKRNVERSVQKISFQLLHDGQRVNKHCLLLKAKANAKDSYFFRSPLSFTFALTQKPYFCTVVISHTTSITLIHCAFQSNPTKMADGTDIRGSAEEAAKALESFTNAISDDIPESRTSSRSVPSAPIEGTEVAARSPTADDPALMPGSEPVFDGTNVDAENESDTDEEVLSGNEETQKVKVAQNASNQLAVAERDEEGSTDIESRSDNEGMDQDNSNSKGANRAPLMQKQRTLLAEETLMDTLSLVATETDEETLLVQEPKEPSNHTRMPQLHFPKTGIANNSSGITRRLGHRRQKSHSQPATPLGLRSREDGLRSPSLS
ncbi:uncharacterized protein LOC135368471 [Ornithodoros turicata]|uniref:uncharacterized protein LOC135368471 n=1 Tax=Ornithodoros turicata TaxID=34597 RepID=UPI00313A42B4